MDALILRLGVTLTVFVVCDPQCCWANKEVTQSCVSELMKGHPKNPWALYEVLKKKEGKYQWLDTFKLMVAEEDLINPRRMNLSNVGPEIALYHYGYLNITSAPKTPDGLYSLDFCELRLRAIPAKTALCMDLMILAEQNDMDVKNAFSIRNTTFERMPPKSNAVKSFMLALDTIISRIPLRFADWQHPAIFGALRKLGLNEVQFGNDLMTHRILFCEDLSNNTRLLFVVDDDHSQNATHSWDSYYCDLMLPILLPLPRKNPTSDSSDH